MSVEPIRIVQQRSPIDALRFTILAGISDPTDDALFERVSFLTSRLDESHFEGTSFAGLFKVLTSYITVSGSAPTLEDFEELLAQTTRIPIETKAALAELYSEVTAESESISNARFRLAVERLRERHRDAIYGQVLETAMRIHSTSATVGDQMLSGFDDSLSYLNTEMSKVNVAASTLSEGELALEVNEVLRAYNSSKTGHSRGILTGFEDLDAVTQGIQPGELALVAAYTGEGKSKISYNIAYHAAFLQGKNVLFGTAEATREQVRRNIVTRHSHHPKFDRRGGLRYSDIKFGSLSPTDEEVLRNVLRDIKVHGVDDDHPNPHYGHIFIANVPHRANIRYIHELYERFSKIAPIDLVIVDYLGLMSSETRRAARREELDDLLVAAKRFAVDKDVALLSPWQVSRTAWAEASKSGHYTKACLSDTSQAERSTDLVLSVLRKEDGPNELNVTVLKSRDSEEDVAFTLQADYATSYVGTDTSLSSVLLR